MRRGRGEKYRVRMRQVYFEKINSRTKLNVEPLTHADLIVITLFL